MTNLIPWRRTATPEPAPHPWGGTTEEWEPRGGYEPAPELLHNPLLPTPTATLPAPPTPDPLTEDAPAFTPAPLTSYREWLAAYLRGGGTPTHFYDRPYRTSRVALAVRDFHTMGECGAASLDILIPAGVRHLGGPLGHCNLYDMATGKAIADRSEALVVLYNDPELLELRGMAKFAQEKREEHQRQEAEMEAKRRRFGMLYSGGDIDRYRKHRRNARRDHE